MNEIKSRFFEKINKIDKPLAWLIKKRRRPKSIESEMKKSYNWCHRNTKDHETLVRTTIYQ